MTRQIKISITIFIVIIIASGGYFAYVKYYKSQKLQNTESSGNIKNQQLAAGNSNATTTLGKTTGNGFSAQGARLPDGQGPASGWKLYKNAEFGFEIQYPESWAVSEENIENARGENTKAFYFKKPNSDLRFAILPRDGLSYGLSENGTSTPVLIGGFPGIQTQYALKDGRRLWLLSPQYRLHSWSEDIGRIDILSSATDPAGDTTIFEKMLSSFKLSY